MGALLLRLPGSSQDKQGGTYCNNIKIFSDSPGSGVLYDYTQSGATYHNNLNTNYETLRQVTFSPIMEVFSISENDDDILDCNLKNTRKVVKKDWGLDGCPQESLNFNVKKKNLKEKLRKFRLASWAVRVCTDFALPLLFTPVD